MNNGILCIDSTPMYSRIIIRSISQYKINAIIKVLILSDFIVWSSYQLMAPIFAVFVADHIVGGSIEVVGVATALFLISKSLFEIPVGLLVDKTKSEFDDLWTAVLGTVLMAGVYTAYAFIETVAAIYTLQIFLGIASALAYPGWYALFTHHVDKGKEAFEWSLYDVLLGLGMAATAALGGFLAERFGFTLLFILVGAFTFMGALILAALKDKIKVSSK